MKKIIYSLFCIVFFSFTIQSYNVGLLVVATAKYIQFVPPLIESAKKYFLPNHNVTYFIFTDQNIETTDHIIKIPYNHQPWPYSTMMRFEGYLKNKDLLLEQDYLFACDADMLFVDTVGDEILSDLVATQHPGYVNKRGTYETRKSSTAYVAPNEGTVYFAGGLYGGAREEVFKLLSTVVTNISEDLEKNIIAIWHDESHLNRYFIDHTPTKILSPSYCYPESWKLPFHKKLLALDKNHNKIRT